MEWTREKTLSLIYEYRKRRGLWDMTHDDYRKKEMKQKLLIEVSASLGGGIPIIEIEKKFHTLRTQYHREINRMKRKEPYNSKWFGFKNLQFLSSPKACRSNKGRIPSKEITEEGTVTTKYIIKEAPLEISGGSANSNNSLINEEFLTIHRKPTTTITYEVAPAAAATVSSAGVVTTSSSAAAAASATAAANTRAHELEKLIEETTKDVEEIEEERKPKMSIKQISVEHHHHHYNYEGGDCAEAAEMETVEEEPLLIAQDQLQIQEDDEEHMDTSVELQAANDEEIAYQSSSSTGGGGHHHTQSNASNNTTVQHQQQQQLHHQQQQTQPTRIIKIQKRDTSHEDDYDYEHHHISAHHQHQAQSQQQQHQQQSFKRSRYDANGHHHTATIINALPTASPQPNAHSTLVNPASLKLKRTHRGSIASSAQAQQTASLSQLTTLRDDFDTYGEYVANEMRGITNRQVLVALKHKINTALFEASMAELQK